MCTKRQCPQLQNLRKKHSKKTKTFEIIMWYRKHKKTHVQAHMKMRVKRNKKKLFFILSNKILLDFLPYINCYLYKLWAYFYFILLQKVALTA